VNEVGISLDFRLPGVTRSPAPRSPKGAAINSVSRGENKDGVLGTSLIARSIVAEDCARVMPGKWRGLCSGMVISIFRSRKGKGREAARLTVVEVLVGGGGAGSIGAFSEIAWVLLSGFGNRGTGGRALLSLRGVARFSNTDSVSVDGRSGFAVAVAVDGVSTGAGLGARGVRGPSGERTNQAGSG